MSKKEINFNLSTDFKNLDEKDFWIHMQIKSGTKIIVSKKKKKKKSGKKRLLNLHQK